MKLVKFIEYVFSCNDEKPIEIRYIISDVYKIILAEPKNSYLNYRCAIIDGIEYIISKSTFDEILKIQIECSDYGTITTL